MGRRGQSVALKAESQGTADNSIADRGQSLGRRAGSLATVDKSIGVRAGSLATVDKSIAIRGESVARKAESQGSLDNSIADHAESEAKRGLSLARLSVIVGITTHATSEPVTAISLYGSVHLVTAAATLTPVAGVIGMSATFIATTAAVFSIDPNAADHFVLAGIALAAGAKISSDGYVGSFVTIIFTATNTWTVTNTGGLWVDSGV
jgi:hypothetical protein